MIPPPAGREVLRACNKNYDITSSLKGTIDQLFLDKQKIKLASAAVPALAVHMMRMRTQSDEYACRKCGCVW